MSRRKEPALSEVTVPAVAAEEWRRRTAALKAAEQAAASYTMGVIDALGITREDVLSFDLERGVVIIKGQLDG